MNKWSVEGGPGAWVHLGRETEWERHVLYHADKWDEAREKEFSTFGLDLGYAGGKLRVDPVIKPIRVGVTNLAAVQFPDAGGMRELAESGLSPDMEKILKKYRRVIENQSGVLVTAPKVTPIEPNDVDSGETHLIATDREVTGERAWVAVLARHGGEGDKGEIDCFNLPGEIKVQRKYYLSDIFYRPLLFLKAGLRAEVLARARLQVEAGDYRGACTFLGECFERVRGVYPVVVAGNARNSVESSTKLLKELADCCDRVPTRNSVIAGERVFVHFVSDIGGWSFFSSLDKMWMLVDVVRIVEKMSPAAAVAVLGDDFLNMGVEWSRPVPKDNPPKRRYPGWCAPLLDREDKRVATGVFVEESVVALPRRIVDSVDFKYDEPAGQYDVLSRVPVIGRLPPVSECDEPGGHVWQANHDGRLTAIVSGLIDFSGPVRGRVTFRFSQHGDLPARMDGGVLLDGQRRLIGYDVRVVEHGVAEARMWRFHEPKTKLEPKSGTG